MEFADNVQNLNFYLVAVGNERSHWQWQGRDVAMAQCLRFTWLCLHIQKDAQGSDASTGVSFEQIQSYVFVLNAFWFPCLGFQDKAFSLILLVFPYTLLTQALNCLFVSTYMKMLRHALVATWWCEWICRMRAGLVHHTIMIPSALSLPLLRGACSSSCTDNISKWLVLYQNLQFFPVSNLFDC